jgi:cytochrome c-type biogenesis protein CcmH/NrfG
MGDIRDGVEAYKKALELEPDMMEAWLNMGQACKEEARVDEADRALTRVGAVFGGGGAVLWMGVCLLLSLTS